MTTGPRRKHVGLGIAIILLGVAIVAGLVIHAVRGIDDRPELFYRQHRNMATRLFAQVEAFDPEDDTLSAREVMELFMATKHLLYGNMIICEDIRETTFIAHRALLSSERTADTTVSEQFTTLMLDIAFLLDQEERMSGFRINSVDYDQFFPERYAVAHVREDLLSLSYYWRYHLINENGRWRVDAWEDITIWPDSPTSP